MWLGQAQQSGKRAKWREKECVWHNGDKQIVDGMTWTTGARSVGRFSDHSLYNDTTYHIYFYSSSRNCLNFLSLFRWWVGLYVWGLRCCSRPNSLTTQTISYPSLSSLISILYLSAPHSPVSFAPWGKKEDPVDREPSLNLHFSHTQHTSWTEFGQDRKRELPQDCTFVYFWNDSRNEFFDGWIVESNLLCV